MPDIPTRRCTSSPRTGTAGSCRRRRSSLRSPGTGPRGRPRSPLERHACKEELQLATIAAANEIFETHVVAPAAGARNGLERLRLLTDGYLRYIERDVFAGGCFFASALSETDTRPGPVRDRLFTFLAEWLGRLDAAIREAQAEGSLDAGEDPADLTFELEAAIFLANAQFVVVHSAEPIERARRIIDRRLRQSSR